MTTKSATLIMEFEFGSNYQLNRNELGMILTKLLWCQKQMKRPSGRLSAEGHPRQGLGTEALLSDICPDFSIPRCGPGSATGMMYV